MLDYLVTSKARRRLLKLLWGQDERGSVSVLARLAGLSFRSAHKELNEMQRAGLAVCSRVGNATVFEAVKGHPETEVLRRLLRERRRVDRMEVFKQQHAQQVRSWLKAWGAPLFAVSTSEQPPSLERVLVQGVKLARSDASVARSLPVCVWKNRRGLDTERLRLEAQRNGEKQTLGFFLELTGTLGGDPDLCTTAESFCDRRVRKQRGFFLNGRSSCARQLAEERTPAVAKKWYFTMNMSMETFASTFRKFVPDAEVPG